MVNTSGVSQGAKFRGLAWRVCETRPSHGDDIVSVAKLAAHRLCFFSRIEAGGAIWQVRHLMGLTAPDLAFRTCIV